MERRKVENQSFTPPFFLTSIHPSHGLTFSLIYRLWHTSTQRYRYVCLLQSASHCCEHGYWAVTINVPVWSIKDLFFPQHSQQMWCPSPPGSTISLTDFEAYCYSIFTRDICTFSPSAVLIDLFEKQTLETDPVCTVNEAISILVIPSLFSCNMMFLRSICISASVLLQWTGAAALLTTSSCISLVTWSDTLKYTCRLSVLSASDSFP